MLLLCMKSHKSRPVIFSKTGLKIADSNRVSLLPSRPIQSPAVGAGAVGTE